MRRHAKGAAAQSGLMGERSTSGEIQVNRESDRSLPAPQTMAVAILDGMPWPVWVCRADAWVDFANAATSDRDGDGPLALRCGHLAGRIDAGFRLWNLINLCAWYDCWIDPA